MLPFRLPKPARNTCVYTFNNRNRVTAVSYPDNTSEAFAYDAASRRVSMTDGTGVTGYAYDAANRLTSLTYPGNRTLVFVYDAAGSRTRLTDHEGRVTNYAYDARDLLQSVTNADNQTTTYQRDALGRVTRQTNGNGTFTDTSFDAAGRPVLVFNRKNDNSVLSSFSYLYDASGNATRIAEADGSTVDYGYDDLNRLIYEKRTGNHPYWYTYALDPVGNRTQLAQKDQQGNIVGTTNATYDSANKLLTYGNTAYAWDANGNLASKTANNQTTAFTWNAANKLTRILHPNGTVQDFAYDGEGVRKTVTVNGAVTQFVPDVGGLSVVAELDASGATVARQTYGAGLVSEWRGGVFRWHSYNALGTTSELTDAAQVVTDTYTLDSFGNTVAESGTTGTPFQYAGRLSYKKDPTSGLMLLGARWYDAATGRFLSQDPIREGVNWYGYAAGNPAIVVDPFGLSAKCWLPWVQWNNPECPGYWMHHWGTWKEGYKPVFEPFMPAVCWMYQMYQHMQQGVMETVQGSLPKFNPAQGMVGQGLMQEAPEIGMAAVQANSQSSRRPIPEPAGDTHRRDWHRSGDRLGAGRGQRNHGRHRWDCKFWRNPGGLCAANGRGQPEFGRPAQFRWSTKRPTE